MVFTGCVFQIHVRFQRDKKPDTENLNMRILRNKSKILAVMTLVFLLGGVGYALADNSSQGTVEVIPEIPKIKGITFPASAAPNTPETLSFVIEYQSGLYEGNGNEMWVHFYSNNANPDLTCAGTPSTVDPFDHYYWKWTNKLDGCIVSEPYGFLSNFICPPSPVIDGSDIPLGLDIKFSELADASLKIHFVFSW